MTTEKTAKLIVEVDDVQRDVAFIFNRRGLKQAYVLMRDGLLSEYPEYMREKNCPCCKQELKV